ncbi:MAG: hypothetical protein WCC36_12955, partial [Gammaproteobacteria bacterium]
MNKPLLIGMSAVALSVAVATSAYANPKNKFGNSNTATVDSTAMANANGGNGGSATGGNGGAGGTTSDTTGTGAGGAGGSASTA